MVFEVDHKRDEGYASRYRGGLFISKKTILIIIAVIVIIALVVGAYFLVKSGFFSNLFKIQLPTVPGVETNESRAQVQNITSSFDGINLYTLDLNQLIAIGKPAVPTLANMLNDSNSSKRYAAIMGLSAIGHNDTSVNVLSDLKKALGDSDVNVRVTAAELVMSFGDKEGIPVLIAELENTATLKPSEPVMPINSYASLVLTRYTDQTFAVDKAKWQEWWLANKDKLKFDKENGKFT